MDQDNDGMIEEEEAERMFGGVADALGADRHTLVGGFQLGSVSSNGITGQKGGSIGMTRDVFRQKLLGPDLSLTGKSGGFSQRSSVSGSGLRTPLPGGGRMLSSR